MEQWMWVFVQLCGMIAVVAVLIIAGPPLPPAGGHRGVTRGEGKIIPPRGGSGVCKPRKNCRCCGGPKDDVCQYCGQGVPDPKRGVSPTIIQQ